jgi:hypothetical protein
MQVALASTIAHKAQRSLDCPRLLLRNFYDFYYTFDLLWD